MSRALPTYIHLDRLEYRRAQVNAIADTLRANGYEICDSEEDNDHIERCFTGAGVYWLVDGHENISLGQVNSERELEEAIQQTLEAMGDDCDWRGWRGWRGWRAMK